MHGEDFGAIEIVLIVHCQHQVTLIQVDELVVVEEHVLLSVWWITTGLRMHIQEGSCLHVQVSAVIEGGVAKDEVVEGREEQEVVEGLLVIVCEEHSIYYQMSCQISSVVCIAIPSVVIPDAVLVVCEVNMTIEDVNRNREIAFTKGAVKVKIGVLNRNGLVLRIKGEKEWVRPSITKHDRLEINALHV